MPPCPPSPFLLRTLVHTSPHYLHQQARSSGVGPIHTSPHYLHQQARSAGVGICSRPHDVDVIADDLRGGLKEFSCVKEQRGHRISITPACKYLLQEQSDCAHTDTSRSLPVTFTNPASGEVLVATPLTPPPAPPRTDLATAVHRVQHCEANNLRRPLRGGGSTIALLPGRRCS